MPAEGDEGWVYFVLCERLMLVKIGWSLYPAARLVQLQQGFPYLLEIVAALPGGKDREAFMHKTYAKQRERGEWFRLTKSLADHIDVARYQHGPAPWPVPAPVVLTPEEIADDERIRLMKIKDMRMSWNTPSLDDAIKRFRAKRLRQPA